MDAARTVIGANGFWHRAKGGEPVGPRALAAHGGIVTMCGTGEMFDDVFEVIPKLNALEHAIHIIRDRAVIRVLRIGMVEPVMPGCLQNAPVLEERDEPPVFFAGAVRHLMNLVRVDADRDKKDQLP